MQPREVVRTLVVDAYSYLVAPTCLQVGSTGDTYLRLGTYLGTVGAATAYKGAVYSMRAIARSDMPLAGEGRESCCNAPFSRCKLQRTLSSVWLGDGG